MTVLTHFFKESDSSFGVFYPKHYIIATFQNFGKAYQAEHALRRAGFTSEEVRSIHGGEILEFFDESQLGAFSSVMKELSRVFGTEQVFADDDAQFAHRGAGFVAIYCPEEAEANRVRALLEPMEPIAMHWYRAGCVQSLI
jgi:hypothetical protein